jgi:hypothetical protein
MHRIDFRVNDRAPRRPLPAAPNHVAATPIADAATSVPALSDLQASEHLPGDWTCSYDLALRTLLP